MIAYITGTLVQQQHDFVIVETHGLGYQIFISHATHDILPEIGQTIKLHTFMNVKEDGITLYGFSNTEELSLFHHLFCINGVGPKAALGFLSHIPPQSLILAVLSEDVKTLCKVPGIGIKTAQRVILELKDKFQKLQILDTMQECSSSNGFTQSTQQEAIDALTALGYSRSEAAKAISGIDCTTHTTEQILKLALKKMIAF